MKRQTTILSKKKKGWPPAIDVIKRKVVVKIAVFLLCKSSSVIWNINSMFQKGHGVHKKKKHSNMSKDDVRPQRTKTHVTLVMHMHGVRVRKDDWTQVAIHHLLIDPTSS